MDIKLGILNLIEATIPSLAGKVFISAAPDKVDETYIVISDASSEPINTTSGSLTAGTLDINIFNRDIEICESIFSQLRTACHQTDIGELRCYYSADKIEFYPDYETYCKILTIKYI